MLNYTEIEAKVREATNDEAWGPTGKTILDFFFLFCPSARPFSNFRIFDYFRGANVVRPNRPAGGLNHLSLYKFAFHFRPPARTFSFSTD